MDRMQIWWDILKDNSRGTANNLGLRWAWDHPMIPVLLFAIYVLLIWSNISAEEASLQLQERLLWLAAPLLLFPVWWLLRLPRTIADREARATKRIGLLHTYLVPRLEFELVNGGEPIEFARGHTVADNGGRLRSNIDNVDLIICGVVRNRSPKDAHMVQARFSELVGNNGQRMRDPVTLGWAPIDGPTETVTVPAFGERTLQLFRVAARGSLYFARNKLPIEYAHFFDEGTEFAGKIAIEEVYHCSLVVQFALDLTGEKPAIRVVHIASATHGITPEQREEELERLEAYG